MFVYNTTQFAVRKLISYLSSTFFAVGGITGIAYLETNDMTLFGYQARELVTLIHANAYSAKDRDRKGRQGKVGTMNPQIGHNVRSASHGNVEV